MVTVFTADKCQPCKATMRALDKAGIHFEPLNTTGEDPIAQANREQAKSYGYTQSPVVVTANGDHWSGFRPDKIEELKAQVAAGLVTAGA